MATTRIMPLHTGKGRDAGTLPSDIIDYVETLKDGQWQTHTACDSRTADADPFLKAKV